MNRRTSLDELETFALLELHAIRPALPAPFAGPLDDTLSSLVATLGAEDALLRGVAMECLEQVDGANDLLAEAARSTHGGVSAGAREVLSRRRSERRLRGWKSMAMKPDAIPLAADDRAWRRT